MIEIAPYDFAALPYDFRDKAYDFTSELSRKHTALTPRFPR